jgi:hypothetical protein
MAKRGRRSVPQHRKVVEFRRSSVKYWPMVVCHGCNRVLAYVLEPVIKRIRGSSSSIDRRRLSIKASHFKTVKCVKLKGYEIDFFAYEDGEHIPCPACGHDADLSMLFPSSRKPSWRTVNDFANKPK